MVARPVVLNHHVVPISYEQSLGTTIKRYRSAVELLVAAYSNKRPASIMTGAGRLGPGHVLGKFLELTADDADTVTISGPCMSATEFMQQIVQGIGFEPNKLSLGDLEGVLDLFLQYQRKKKRRTVIVVPDFEDHGWWVLDKIRRLIEGEVEEENGLMLLLAGAPSNNVLLNEPVLDAISDHAGDRIVLEPFSLTETRDFIRNHIMSSTIADNVRDDIGELIEFGATDMIHDVCQGIPDDVYRMCSKCTEMLAVSGGAQITKAIATEAAVLTGLTDPQDESTSDTAAVNVCEETETVEEVEEPAYLVIESNSEPTQKIPLNGNNLVLGRDKVCDLCIEGLRISRFHSIFSLTPDGLVVADLGSTNGTFVNGKKVERSTLDPDDIVKIGHTQIRYIPAVDTTPKKPVNGNQKLNGDPVEEIAINHIGSTFQFLRTS